MSVALRTPFTRSGRMKFSLGLKRAEQLFYRWAEEPIGVVVPFIAFLAVWLPPQMPDMFAGMDAPILRCADSRH